MLHNFNEKLHYLHMKIYALNDGYVPSIVAEFRFS
jgi:hypothetical protein